ncbi:MAG: TRAP transporter small permease [Thiothrix sp.]|nr:MAG: TRAP transporter small permease [Thiothrix sp.]
MENKSRLSTVIRYLHHSEDLILTLLLIGLIGISSLQIVLRNFFDYSFLWADPFSRNLVLWLGLLGAATASRGNKHITIDLTGHLLKGKKLHFLRLITSVFTIAVCGVVAWYSAQYVLLEAESSGTAFLNIPYWVLPAIIPFSFALIAFRYTLQAVTHAMGLFGHRVS